MSAELINGIYIIAAILFIFGLKRMAHPRTAVRGNLYGALGMLLALAVTLPLLAFAALTEKVGNLRIEVPERTLADGSVHTPVDTEAVANAVQTLLEQGVEAVCIVFINAYANDRNEQQALQTVRALWPNPHVAASSQILPEIREFERTSTTVANAYVRPVAEGYLHRLADAHRDPLSTPLSLHRKSRSP